MKDWTYEKAGVPHLKGDPAYNRQIARLIASTRISGVMGSPTGFASLFDPKKSGFKDPLLVSSTDGVGTKLEIARLQQRHDTVGIDLVAMCVNDIITCGARPLFFLDYFASGRFDAETIRAVLQGVVKGCREAGCALTGGETAIMPGFYDTAGRGGGEYDIAGFAVGMVERRKLINGNGIRQGHTVLGLASSGFHSNGYSLLRKIFSKKQLRGKIGKKLLTPTRIYGRPVLKLLERLPLKGIINITGGGFIDNLPRVIPAGLCAQIRPGSWPVPKLFQTVRDSGNISAFEMFRTFNMGIGMVLILENGYAAKARSLLSGMKIPSWEIGRISRASSSKERVEVLF